MGTDNAIDDVNDASIDLTLRPLTSTGIWDWDNHNDVNVRHFFFPGDDRGNWGPMRLLSRDVGEHAIVWNLRSKAVLRMRWSKRNTEERDYAEGDAHLEFRGVLAPMLLAWIEDDNKGREWRTKLTPTDYSRKAPFALDFSPRSLPRRPQRP